jgi:hypothetical protein
VGVLDEKRCNTISDTETGEPGQASALAAAVGGLEILGPWTAAGAAGLPASALAAAVDGSVPWMAAGAAGLSASALDRGGGASGGVLYGGAAGHHRGLAGTPFGA